MSKDSVLKKQFQEKDVQRLRNLMTGKYGDKTIKSVGYRKAQVTHNEGDIWEEDGRTWTIKDGIKQNITKLDKAKKSYVVPLFCPKCKKQMKLKNDHELYKIHKMCLSCVVDMEHELQKDGKWDEYQQKIKNNEIDNKIKDFKDYVKDRLSESNNNFISEAGDKETWKGKIDEKRVDEHLSQVIEYLESLKK
jgi:hypothetical protein|tara:strand:- start:180 stop:755 length:576 start_codon:yes stop_codon:yes gene_type:complete